MKNIAKLLVSVLALTILSFPIHADDDDKPPAWTKNPTRTVDNGYIVYVAKGEDRSPERARLKAEGSAIQDLANECSFAPKGSRVEDSFEQVKNDNSKIYVKLAVEFTDCDEAKKTNDPQEIKKMASLPMTEELKRYQDLVDAPQEVASNSNPSITPPPGVSGSPGQTVAQQTVIIHDEPSFFYWRQQVVYEKEVVIVSPPTAYAPGSPENTAFVNHVGPMTQQIGTYEHNNPQIMKSGQTWSSLPNRPYVAKPQSLAPGATKAVTPPKKLENNQHQNHSSSQGSHRGRHHRF